MNQAGETKKQQFNLLKVKQQSTYLERAKPHAHLMLTQMSVKLGIEKFGKKEYNALIKEMHQLHIREAMLPKQKDE